MANNPYVNKVIYGGTTLIDISDTTATADKILEGYTAYGANGQKITGTASGQSLLIVDTLDENGGTIRTITGKVVQLQTKTITPTSSQQVVNPDTGYDGFSRVTVEASEGQTINNQNKTITPTEAVQNVTADSGYTGLGTVIVDGIPLDYVGSGIDRRSSSDLTANGATVTVPEGYYENQATKTVASGTEGTPTATKGTVSNNSVTVTPSVTNTEGYISGGTKTGTAVTVTASELVSGTKTIDANQSGVDVTNYARVDVSVPIPIPDLQTKEVNPTEAVQHVTADSGYDGLDEVTVYGIPLDYVGSGIDQRSSSDLTASGATVTVPAGYYENQASKAIATGSAKPAASISGSSATVSAGTNTLTLTKSVSNTPQVTAGYISSGTAGNTSVSLTASVTTKAAATIMPGTSNQTISSGTYLTGTQTIAGDANLVGSNIISGKSIFGVSGSVVINKYYTGSSAPSSSLGSDGDIYFKTN